MDDFSTTTQFSYRNNETIFNTAVSKGEYVKAYNEITAYILAVFIGAMCVFGILANGTTMYVIYKSPNLRSAFNYFLLSLALSDLMSSVISPLFLYRISWGFKEWKLPEFLCTILVASDHGTSVLTSLHIMVFSGLRFISLKLPHKFNKFTLKHAKTVILILWIIAIGGGFVPYLMWFGLMGWLYIPFLPQCAIRSAKALDQYFTYTPIGNTIFFFIPCFMVMVFCGGISILLISRRAERKKKSQQKSLEQTEINRRKKENRAIFQLGLIVGSFMLGYFPNCVYNLYSMTEVGKKQDPVSGWWINLATYLLLRISECLNPIFYNVGSSKMRNETKKFLEGTFSCFVSNEEKPKCAPTATGNKKKTVETVA